MSTLEPPIQQNEEDEPHWKQDIFKQLENRDNSVQILKNLYDSCI